MKIYKTISVLLLVMAMGCGVAQAQIVTTPYSKMAYGMLNDNVSSIQRSMGGVGYAMRGGRIVNVMNPASYADVDSLTFLWDVGIDLSNLWSKEEDNKGYNFGAGLDYLKVPHSVCCPTRQWAIPMAARLLVATRCAPVTADSTSSSWASVISLSRT